MESVQNQHWEHIRKSSASADWVSYLALRASESSPFTTWQRDVMSRYLTGSVDTYIGSQEILQTDPYTPELEVVATIEAADSDEAMENSIAAGLGALASIGVRLETVEFLALHLTERAQLETDRYTIPTLLIINDQYDVSETAQEVFIEEMELMADCQLATRLYAP
jgi:hypothetical protein